MADSLRRFGQVSPLVVTPREGALAVVDGFKRVAAAERIELETLVVRSVPLRDRAAVGAIYSFNRGGKGLGDLEEAFVVQELVRRLGMTQPEVGELLGRHKSWVSRRLSLVERLSDDVLALVRVGFLNTTMTRSLMRLPHGNQKEVADAVHRHGLTTREGATVVALYEACESREQKAELLADPVAAIEAHRGHGRCSPTDPRLSAQVNKIRRQLLSVTEGNARLQRLLGEQAPTSWTPLERHLLTSPLDAATASARRLCEALEGVAQPQGGRDP